MKITIEQYEEKFTYEGAEGSPVDEVIETFYRLCIAMGYHPDSVGGAMYDKGREVSEVEEKDVISSGVYEPEKDEFVVKSRYGEERKFTTVAKNCVEYSFKDVEHVGCSRNDDGSLHSVDPSGGPYIAIGTMLGNVSKELEGLTVTKIKADTDKVGTYYLTVK